MKSFTKECKLKEKCKLYRRECAGFLNDYDDNDIKKCGDFEEKAQKSTKPSKRKWA